MSIDSDRAAAIAIVRSIGAGDLALEAFAPDATWWMQGQGERSVVEVADMIRAFHKARLRDGRMDVIGTTAEANRVALEAECRFVLTDGGTYAGSYHFVIAFRDGRACLVREYFDTALAARTFGRG